MKIELEPGKYVIAVSGGVDSIALLHLLTTTYNLQPTTYNFVVAHFDHGIREDSIKDRQFVEKLAEKYNVPFHYTEGNLGAEASEAKARTARYDFLRKIRKSSESRAIITAHHQDDLIETAFINILRGTGRKGLSSLGSGKDIVRPLLNMSKQDIKAYAQKHNLVWREDSTNLDNKYLRNNLRNKILPKLTNEQRKKLIDILDSAKLRNSQIDDILGSLLSTEQDMQIDRFWFIALPHAVAREALSHWLRQRGVSFDRTAIERLVTSLKTLPQNSKVDISGGWYFTINKDYIRMSRRSSV